jgi:hypothetical protein
LVGKDILRFHTVYWFSFLLAANLKLPKTVYAHGMWLDADGRKMGKTLGNVIELDTLQKTFFDDAIRYFVLREMVFGQDGKFGYESLIERANADLANGLGNLSIAHAFDDYEISATARIPDGKISGIIIIFTPNAPESTRTSRNWFRFSNTRATNFCGNSTITNSAARLKPFGRDCELTK